ncbi:MAG: glycosyltransferase family 2 protein [Flavobacteriaceae bacterium]|nr:glycosyltransferase family 2 protein [Flavobacteriaceae bacterium]
MRNEKHLVSIIIPIYNVEDFLDDTIQSVINQSFNQWELILIDDGSSDSSVSICEKYLQDMRIKLFQQDNSGVSIARNNGLLQASGDYIFFMDADDTIDKDFIKTCIEIATKENYDLVVVGEYFKQRFPNIYALPTCAMFLKHSFLKKYSDIRFPKNIQPCEDGLFSHQLLALTEKVGFNPLGIYHYRKHHNQNTQIIKKNTDDVLTQIPKWFEILEKFYIKYDLFKQKNVHLALFLQHEPYQLRYLDMPLNREQKEFVFRLIKTFFNKNLHLCETQKEILSRDFRYFIKTNNSIEFDEFYQKYSKTHNFWVKVQLFFTKFIPFNTIRREQRKKLNLLLK